MRNNIYFNFEFVIRRIGDLFVLVPVKENSFNGLLLINLTTKFIIENLPNDEDTLTKLYKNWFNVSEIIAHKDVSLVLRVLSNTGAIGGLYRNN